MQILVLYSKFIHAKFEISQITWYLLKICMFYPWDIWNFKHSCRDRSIPTCRAATSRENSARLNHADVSLDNWQCITCAPWPITAKLSISATYQQCRLIADSYNPAHTQGKGTNMVPNIWNFITGHSFNDATQVRHLSPAKYMKQLIW